MKIFKKLFTSILAGAMVIGMSVGAFATEKEYDEKMNINEVIAQLNATDFGTEITFSALPGARSGNQKLLKFNSVEDAEIYLKDLMAARTELMAYQEEFGQGQHQSKTFLNRANTGWYTNTVKWWGGGNTSLLSMTNADVRFYYKDGEASNISVTDSYMTGIVGATWTHRRGTATPLGGTNAKVSATGTWFIGLDIFGFPVGASFDETLTCKSVSVW